MRIVEMQDLLWLQNACTPRWNHWMPLWGETVERPYWMLFFPASALGSRLRAHQEAM